MPGSLCPPDPDPPGSPHPCPHPHGRVPLSPRIRPRVPLSPLSPLVPGLSVSPGPPPSRGVRGPTAPPGGRRAALQAPRSRRAPPAPPPVKVKANSSCNVFFCKTTGKKTTRRGLCSERYSRALFVFTRPTAISTVMSLKPLTGACGCLLLPYPPVSRSLSPTPGSSAAGRGYGCELLFDTFGFEARASSQLQFKHLSGDLCHRDNPAVAMRRDLASAVIPCKTHFRHAGELSPCTKVPPFPVVTRAVSRLCPWSGSSGHCRTGTWPARNAPAQGESGLGPVLFLPSKRNGGVREKYCLPH